MRSIEKNMPIWISTFILTFFATSASLGVFFVKFPLKLFFIVTLIAILILNTLGKPLGKKWYVILGLLMIAFYCFNNLDHKTIGSIVAFLQFPVMIYMVIYARAINSKYFTTPLKAMKPVYMFYVLYTILMFFFRPLLDFTVRIFPPSVVDTARLIRLYNRGCMPGLTTHYSTNGMLIAIGIILFGCYMIYRKNKQSILWFALCIIAVLLTGKRAHILFTCAALYLSYFVYSADKKKGRILKSIWILLVAMVILLIICNYVPALSTFVTRFIDTADEGDVTLGRSDMWEFALNLFAKNPVFGIGWGQFAKQGYGIYDAHNIYIQLLCETGISGFAIYLIWMIGFLKQTWTKLANVRKRHRVYAEEDGYYLLISLSIQIFFLMYGFTGNPLYEPITYIPYFIACALSIIYPKKQKYNLERSFI